MKKTRSGVVMGAVVVLLLAAGWMVVRQRHTSPPSIVVIHQQSAPVQKQKQQQRRPVHQELPNRGPPVFPDKPPIYQVARPSSWQMMGFLTPPPTEGKDPTILPLFGRPSTTRRERWEYYAATDKNTMIRVPILFEKRDCMDEVGCNEIRTGDSVSVPTYSSSPGTFTATMYGYR